mmetsp:Transcript_54183/g.96892  ORF Transcript_54183/g.96892 Transcript_54183/m.96892 type:complete len:243 (+) Transcript_54183:341-1069(+)
MDTLGGNTGGGIKEVAPGLHSLNQDTSAFVLHNLPKCLVVVVGICHHRGLYILMCPATLLSTLLFNVNALAGNAMGRIEEVAACLDSFDQEGAVFMLHDLPERLVVVVGICHDCRLNILMNPATLLAPLVSNMDALRGHTKGGIEEVAPSLHSLNQDIAAFVLHNLPECLVVVVGICHQCSLCSIVCPAALLAPRLSNMDALRGNTMSGIKEVASSLHRLNQNASLVPHNLREHRVVADCIH